jgi:hypothetical protein
MQASGDTAACGREPGERGKHRTEATEVTAGDGGELYAEPGSTIKAGGGLGTPDLTE